MAIHFYPKVGGRVDFDTPEEAAAFFAITGGGTTEAPKPEIRTEVRTVVEPPTTLPKATVKKKTPGLSHRTQRLEDSIQMIMGELELSSHEILVKLKENGWGPESKDQLSYIRYTLSSNPAIFQRASRGRYHLDPSNPYTVGVHTHPIEGHINPKSKKSVSKPKRAKTANAEPVAALPQVRVTQEEPVVEPPEVENGEPEVETLVAQLSAPEPEVMQVQAPDPEVMQVQALDPEPPPVVQAPEPEVIKAPEPLIVAAPEPVQPTVVEPPKVIDPAEDPVVDILNEFASELGSI